MSEKISLDSSEIEYYLSYMGASTGYRIIMFQDLLFRYIRPGDGKNAAWGLKIIFLGDFL